MFDWNHLRYLLAISRHRSLSGAARELSVEHSTVGRRLTQLETSLQARLFDRTPEGYLPTAAGEAVLTRANAMEIEALAIEREISGRDTRVSGSVRVSALAACLTDFILPALPEFHERNPGLEIILSSEMRLVDLGRREADIAIRFNRPKEPNLVTRRLTESCSALYASREYVSRYGKLKDAKNLHGHRLIGFAPEFSMATEDQYIRKHADKNSVVISVDSVLSLRAAVRSGAGIGIMECYLGDSEPDLVRIWNEPVLRETWWLAVHRDLRHAARIRAVIDFLIELTEANQDRLLGV